jgi:hypothetical protein
VTLLDKAHQLYNAYIASGDIDTRALLAQIERA